MGPREPVRSDLLHQIRSESCSRAVCFWNRTQGMFCCFYPVDMNAATNCVKRGDGLDVSLDKVPPNHALLDPRMLEAEAFGLLDRMLGVLQDNSR